MIPVTLPRAKGRSRPVTGMNGLESRYETDLRLRQVAGEVTWYRFESLKFRLADNTFYTPDFMVMLAGGEIELHEVKGHWEDDARVKIKVAAAMYPFRFVGVQRKKGQWLYEDFS